MGGRAIARGRGAGQGAGRAEAAILEQGADDHPPCRMNEVTMTRIDGDLDHTHSIQRSLQRASGLRPAETLYLYRLALITEQSRTGRAHYPAKLNIFIEGL